MAGAARTARPVRLPDSPLVLSVCVDVAGVEYVSPEVAVDGGENPVASIAAAGGDYAYYATFVPHPAVRVRSPNVVRDYG